MSSPRWFSFPGVETRPQPKQPGSTAPAYPPRCPGGARRYNGRILFLSTRETRRPSSPPPPSGARHLLLQNEDDGKAHALELSLGSHSISSDKSVDRLQGLLPRRCEFASVSCFLCFLLRKGSLTCVCSPQVQCHFPMGTGNQCCGEIAHARGKRSLIGAQLGIGDDWPLTWWLTRIGQITSV